MQERQSARQAPALFALLLIVEFLVLTALYESCSIHTAVMLAVRPSHALILTR